MSKTPWVTFRFLVFYLACGIFAGLAHAYMMPGSPNPLIGASGAVAGVIAAYLMLHPRVRVWVLAFQFIPLRLSAALVLGVWVLTQFIMILLRKSGRWRGGRILGGLLAGPSSSSSCDDPAYRFLTADCPASETAGSQR